MNIFFMIGDEIVTPALTGSILSGITRDSVIALAESWGRTVSQRRISIAEIIEAHDQGELKEVFGSGTAAVISPVGRIKYSGREMVVGDGNVGPFAAKLFKELVDIQYGRAQDPFGWVITV